MAKIGYERIEETEGLEKAFDRDMETYLEKGYSKQWINQRQKSIEIRKQLIDDFVDLIPKILPNISELTT